MIRKTTKKRGRRPRKAKKNNPNTPPPHEPLHFIYEWRKFHDLNQDELAEAAGIATASISQLETYGQGFTSQTLLKLAKALKCTPADLLCVNPQDEDSIQAIWARLDDERRSRALAVLRDMLRASGSRHAAE